MLSLPTAVRVYLARGATDMRKSIDGLTGGAIGTPKGLSDHPRAEWDGRRGCRV
jgi:hypothetical protein